MYIVLNIHQMWKSDILDHLLKRFNQLRSWNMSKTHSIQLLGEINLHIFSTTQKGFKDNYHFEVLGK